MGCYIGNTTEAGWNLIYKWATAQDVPITYDVNNSASFSGSFSRILYTVSYPEPSTGKFHRCWAEMDDFTGGQVNRVGVPESWTYEVDVTNLKYYYSNDVSSFPGASTSTIYNSSNYVNGRINFWPSNYGTTGGNDSTYDYDDSGFSSDNGFGSFQLFDMTNGGKCVFAWNAWKYSGGASNLGMGNSTSTHPDWTFVYNEGSFPGSYIEAYVQ